jgi:hypothetical protein
VIFTTLWGFNRDVDVMCVVVVFYSDSVEFYMVLVLVVLLVCFQSAKYFCPQIQLCAC